MSTSTLQTITLIISIISLVLSVTAVTWQFVTWKFSGSVVRVELLAGAAGRGGIVSGKIETFKPSQLLEQGFQEFLFVIRARNIGRLAVDVTSWSVSMPSGFSYTLPGFHLNSEVPYRLNAGTVVDFYVPMRDIYAAVQAARESGILRKTHGDRIAGRVSLATGEERESDTHELPQLKGSV